MNILPLPTPLGVFQQHIINEPVHLRIQPNSESSYPIITDQYGRQIIDWHRPSGYKNDCYLPGQAEKLYTLRPKDGGLKRFFSDGVPAFIITTPNGQDICSFNAVETMKNRSKAGRIFNVDFVNTIGDGQKVRLNLRRSLWSEDTALMLGHIPVALIRRPQWRMTDYFNNQYKNSLSCPDDTYEVVVAPGADLVWICTILSCIDILYFA